MLKNKKVVIIEPDHNFRHFVSAVIKQELNCGKILEFGNSADALTILAAPVQIRTLDLIICGSEEVDSISEAFWGGSGGMAKRNIPLLVIFGSDDNRAMESMVKSGAEGIVDKGISPRGLIDKISSALRLKEKREIVRATPGNEIRVKITFAGGESYEGSLENISKSGCAVRSPLFSHGICGLYEKVTLDIFHSGPDFWAKAEMVNMISDPNQQPPRSSMRVGFEFGELSVETKKKIESMINDIQSRD